MHKLVSLLLVVGGLNWGLVGLAMLFTDGSNWNVVNLLLGSWPAVEAVVYVLVGVSAVLGVFGCKCSKCQAACESCKVDGKMEGNSNM